MFINRLYSFHESIIPVEEKIRFLLFFNTTNDYSEENVTIAISTFLENPFIPMQKLP